MSTKFQIPGRGLILACALVISSTAVHPRGFSVQGGLSQPVLGGGNIAATYYGERFLFEYSHGWDLGFHRAGGAALTPEERSQDLQIRLPYTTGFGLGYLITENLDVRLELKEHFYRVQHPDSVAERYVYDQLGLRSSVGLQQYDTNNLETLYLLGGLGFPVRNANDFLVESVRKAILQELVYGGSAQLWNRTARYRTRSVGIGVYYRFFFNEDNTGLMLEPSIRFWPNVWNDLRRGRVVFENRNGLTDIHDAHDQGLFMNVSFGYYWKF